jgi:hypothetical protein
MSLHADWAAKKQAVKLFKDAQKNWLKKQDAKINASNDPKARKKALDAVLDDAGLEKGESLCTRLREHVQNDLNRDVIRKFKANADVKRQLGIADLTALKQEVRDTAAKYNEQIERARKPPGTVPLLRSPRSKTGTVPFAQAVFG